MTCCLTDSIGSAESQTPDGDSRVCLSEQVEPASWAAAPHEALFASRDTES